METGYSGIIFDFNGTLFFDSDKQEASWEIMSMRLRGRAFGKQEMQRRMHGRSGKSIFEYLLERDVPDDEVLRLMAEKEEIYRDLCLKDRERFHLAPGAVELLDWIKERRVPRTIATASEIVNVTFFIRSFGLERWFDPEKIVYDDGALPGKPNPDIYLKAARTIGLAPSRCVVVEDAVSGIEAARRAGAGYIVAMDSGATDPAVLARLDGVARVIRSFDDFDRNLLTVGA